MRVIRLHKPFDMRFHDEPVPEIGPDEVLIRVGSVGVCASDLHYYREGRIGELKREVNALAVRLGQPLPYGTPETVERKESG